MGLLAWIAVGLATGWLTGAYIQSSGYGQLGDVILGVIGAISGGFVAAILFSANHPISGLSWPSLITAALAAGSIVSAVGSYSGRAPI